ncbi:unnamed protein product [Prorocentrum cordatum]|uniref:Uncharacterized protein n=1 Tax=Prorocentrum cordatum TaxID=2364126 RepID=A0ABN9SUJ2_9DINO|nr:unnamed protein product [Polarella glacialis]
MGVRAAAAWARTRASATRAWASSSGRGGGLAASGGGGAAGWEEGTPLAVARGEKSAILAVPLGRLPPLTSDGPPRYHRCADTSVAAVQKQGYIGGKFSFDVIANNLGTSLRSGIQELGHGCLLTVCDVSNNVFTLESREANSGQDAEGNGYGTDSVVVLAEFCKHVGGHGRWRADFFSYVFFLLTFVFYPRWYRLLRVPQGISVGKMLDPVFWCSPIWTCGTCRGRCAASVAPVRVQRGPVWSGPIAGRPTWVCMIGV